MKSDYRVTRINLADIKYIEGMSEYVRIFVEGEAKPIMPLLSMKRLEETLPPLSVYAGTSFLYCQFEKDNGSFSPAHRFWRDLYSGRREL